MSFTITHQKCKVCEKTVNLTELLYTDGFVYHKSCYKCDDCKNRLQINTSSNIQHRAMSDEILECVLPHIQDPLHRAAVSLVCRQWHELDRLTRRHVTIAFCYTTTPQQLLGRFPNIKSLKLKGKPRGYKFNLVLENWGGYVRPWVDTLTLFPHLNSLHFRRMIVSDVDLETIATVKGRDLQSLKLDLCSGFTTDGLLHITRSCKKLRTLFLQGSKITAKDGEWFHQLAVNNTTLETLNFYVTSLGRHISVEHFELLARNCPLTSLSIHNTELVHLENFFRTATLLQEFCGGCTYQPLDTYSNIVFPRRLTSLGLIHMLFTPIPALFPLAHQLKKLDLVLSKLTIAAHSDLLGRCHSLEVLEITAEFLGDQGLEVVSSKCKRLKRLRIESGGDDLHVGMQMETGEVTQRGIIAVAQGCTELEYLAVYVMAITNEALEHIGANLRRLYDFRLVLLSGQGTGTDLPLDNGVQALLQGCQNMRTFMLYVHGRGVGITDVGLGHVGQLSKNVRWMFLAGNVGETDAGLISLSTGCQNLRKLEMLGCCFTQPALLIAATQLRSRSLRYMSVQRYREPQTSTFGLLKGTSPFWNVEIFPGDEYNVNNSYGAYPARVCYPSHIVAYLSLAGRRIDTPENVLNFL